MRKNKKINQRRSVTISLSPSSIVPQIIRIFGYCDCKARIPKIRKLIGMIYTGICKDPGVLEKGERLHLILINHVRNYNNNDHEIKDNENNYNHRGKQKINY